MIRVVEVEMVEVEKVVVAVVERAEVAVAVERGVVVAGEAWENATLPPPEGGSERDGGRVRNGERDRE